MLEEALPVMLRGLVFVLVLMGVSHGVGMFHLLGSDEAWLVSGMVGVLVVYWIPPRPPQSYLGWLRGGWMLVIGAYLSIFKFPSLISNGVEYRFAPFIGLLVYTAFVCLLFKRSSRANPKQHEMDS